MKFMNGAEAEQLIAENQRLKHEAEYWKKTCCETEAKLAKARCFLEIIGEIVGRAFDD